MSASPTQAGTRKVIAGAALLLLVLLIIAASVLIEFLGRGPESIIIIIFLWAPAIACAAAFAVFSRSSPVARLFVVLAGLGSPFLAAWSIPVTAPLAAMLSSAERSAAANREVEHLAFLQEHFSEPRPVIFADYPFVVVEGGFSLKLYGMYIQSENHEAVERYFEATLTGKTVTADFPPNFFERYAASGRRGVTYPYRAGPSRNFGDAPAFVFVDGEFVNWEITRRWGNGRYPKSWPPEYAGTTRGEVR